MPEIVETEFTDIKETQPEFFKFGKGDKIDRSALVLLLDKDRGPVAGNAFRWVADGVKGIKAKKGDLFFLTFQNEALREVTAWAPMPKREW
jgi:hypothetical protein